MIDSRAIVDPQARLADGVSVGPFSIIGPDVEIGEDTWIGPHVTISGPTTIGKQNKIYQFAALGEAPQDKHYQGESTRLEIGDDNILREYVTISRGTKNGRSLTSVGNDNFIMAYSHIAHDCAVGDHTIFANGASLAGHVRVEDYAILSGFTLVHQFVSLGAHCFCAMGSAIAKDVPPFIRVTGNPAKPFGLNSEGLKRRGFGNDVMTQLKKAYKVLYKSRLNLEQAVIELEKMASEYAEIQDFVTFIKNSKRSIIR